MPEPLAQGSGGRLPHGGGRLPHGGGRLLDGGGRLLDGGGRLSAGCGRLPHGGGRLPDGGGQLPHDVVRLPHGVVRLRARLEAMRANGMSETAVRRALHLSEAEAVAHGIIAPVQDLDRGAGSGGGAGACAGTGAGGGAVANGLAVAARAQRPGATLPPAALRPVLRPLCARRPCARLLRVRLLCARPGAPGWSTFWRPSPGPAASARRICLVPDRPGTWPGSGSWSCICCAAVAPGPRCRRSRVS